MGSFTAGLAWGSIGCWFAVLGCICMVLCVRFVLVYLDLHHFQRNPMGNVHRNVKFQTNRKHAPSHWQGVFFVNFHKFHCFLKVRYRFSKIEIFFKIVPNLKPYKKLIGFCGFAAFPTKLYGMLAQEFEVLGQ